MRESRTYGSVRGALSNERPYRVLNHAIILDCCELLPHRNIDGRFTSI
jgi:hypothetical protein